jgi:RNA polymerase sigma-70 factor (ECF subfamily)
MNLEQSLNQARGDNTAFKEIYDLTIGRMYSFVLLRTKNRAQALDICQDIYLSFWNALPGFHYMGEPHFYAFLFKIARRQISKARMKVHATVELDEVFDIPVEEDEKEDYRTLLGKVRNLKENERLCVELRYFKDLKFQDIAEILGISENNTKVLHHRTINKLRKDLQNYE